MSACIFSAALEFFNANYVTPTEVCAKIASGTVKVVAKTVQLTPVQNQMSNSVLFNTVNLEPILILKCLTQN
jgi:hypothetical protein